MSLGDFFGRTGRGLAIGAAILGAVGMTAPTRPAHALSPGAGVGIGLGAFAAGAMLGAASNPNYGAYRNPYGYYGAPPPAYTPAPAYYPPRSYYPPTSYYPATSSYYSRSYYQPQSCGYAYSWRSYVC